MPPVSAGIMIRTPIFVASSRLRANRRRGCGKVGNAQRFPRGRSPRLFHSSWPPRSQTPKASGTPGCCAAVPGCIRPARQRSSAAPRTNSRTNSPADIRPAVCHENFPHARSASVAPAGCAPTRSSAPYTRPENAAGQFRPIVAADHLRGVRRVRHEGVTGESL